MTTSLKFVTLVSFAVTFLSLLSIVILEKAVDGSGEKPGESIDVPVKVAVFNGCGRSGLAAMFAGKLRDNGFDVVNGMGENADSFDFDTSVVVIRRESGAEGAVNVADALGIKEIIVQYTDDPYLIEDVAVILGRDWHTLIYSEEE